MAYIKGEDRYQITMFPDSIDEYITEENPVRLIEAYVEGLDLEKLDNMALRAKKLLGGKEFDTLADKGYYKAEDLKKCVDNGMTPYVAKQTYSRC